MRPELVQKPVGLLRLGEVHLFLQRAVPKEERLSSALDRLSELGWSRETAKRLFLTYRAIARDLDYSDLHEVYRKANRAESLHDGTDPFASHILDIEALCEAFESKDHALLVGLLAAKKVKITRHADKGRILRELRRMVDSRTTRRRTSTIALSVRQITPGLCLPSLTRRPSPTVAT